MKDNFIFTMSEQKGLNTVQKYVLEYFLKENVMPTVREIADHFKWSSISYPHRMLQLLIDCQVLRKLKGRYTFDPRFYKISIEEMNISDKEDEKWRKKALSYNS